MGQRLALRVRERVTPRGLAGAYVLGVMFSFAFWPTLFWLFFGLTVPLAFRSAGGWAFPGLFAVGSSVPLLLVTTLVAAGAGAAEAWTGGIRASSESSGLARPCCSLSPVCTTRSSTGRSEAMGPRRTASLWVLAAALSIVPAGGIFAGLKWSPRGAAQSPGTSLEQLGDYGRIPPFVLIERSGRQMDLNDLRGFVWAADFIYTECTESCPTQSLQLAQIQREFEATADFRLVSFTVDPFHDTPEVLRRYAERYAAGERWWFLTGDKREIYCLAQEGFRLGVTDPAAPEPPACRHALRLGPAPAWASHGSKGLIMHSARIVLVDRAVRIRAYHLATDTESMTRLRANLRTLLAEQPPKEMTR